MNEYWLKLKEWWSNLNTREKRIVSIGGFFVGFFLLYEMIWSPTLDHLNTMRKRIDSNQKLLVWMQSVDQQIKQVEGSGKNSAKTMSPVVLLGILQKQITQSGLESALTSLKQSSNDSIEMNFQKVEFDKLISLLTKMVKEQHVSITQMSVNADTTLGLVGADIMISI